MVSTTIVSIKRKPGRYGILFVLKKKENEGEQTTPPDRYSAGLPVRERMETGGHRGR